MSNPNQIRLEMNLIGAPGSKKSEVAVRFEEISRDFFKQNDIAPLHVVEANDLTTQGRPTGPGGDHYVTLATYFNRARAEDQIRLFGDSILTVGSIIDSLAHLNVRLKALASGVLTEETNALGQREMLVGSLFDTYFRDQRWMPSFAWYSALPPQVVIPGHETENYASEVDAMIRDLNTRIPLGIPMVDGTVEEKAEQMFEGLKDNFVDNRPQEHDRVIVTGDDGSGGDGV